MTQCNDIDIGSLLSRNPTAHKWRAPYFNLLVRECASWRTHELLQQARLLQQAGAKLGAIVLVRAAVETIAVLVYLNEITDGLMAGRIDYDAYHSKIRALAVGSKDNSTPYAAVNVMTMIQKSERRHPQLLKIYNLLSEIAHPNHDGLLAGYAKQNRQEFTTLLSRQWLPSWDRRLSAMIAVLISTYFLEYNQTWSETFCRLESWLVENDDELQQKFGNKPAM